MSTSSTSTVTTTLATTTTSLVTRNGTLYVTQQNNTSTNVYLYKSNIHIHL